MGSARGDHPALRAVEDLRVVETRWPDSHRCPDSLVLKMALDAGPFMRLGTRGSPSWPGFDPENGYVDADCSDSSRKLLADETVVHAMQNLDIELRLGFESY